MNGLTRWLFRRSPLVLLLRVPAQPISIEALRRRIEDACRGLFQDKGPQTADPGPVRVVFLEGLSRTRPGARSRVIPFLSSRYLDDQRRWETLFGLARIIDDTPAPPRPGTSSRVLRWIPRQAPACA